MVGGFFGGLALGALALGRRIDRSAHPARWYIACELAMALWAALLVLVMAPASRWLMLATGQAVRPVADVRQMLAQVQRPLLDVLRTSPDFRPADDPLLQMASALAGHDAGAAQALLQDLQRLQPERPEAAVLLQRVPAERP